MAKYVVGQEVLVKPVEFLVEHRNEGPCVNGSMLQYANKIMQITAVAERPNYTRYRSRGYWWDESWLDLPMNLEINTDAVMDLLNI